MEILENIRKSILKVKYELERNKYIKGILADIGEIVEDEQSIICYVKQELLDRNSKPNFYELRLFGMNNRYEKSKEKIDYYKLDKPVHYIFNGITFDVPILISSFFCDITFINCVFSHSYFKIFHADKITFAGNKFYDGVSIIEGSFLKTISSSKIGELEFRNELFMNQYDLKEYGENNFGIDINADRINIINSTIIADEQNGQINMKAKRIKIVKSNIISSEINLDALIVNMDRKSKLKARKGIVVGNVDASCDADICLDDIFSPFVVFNNIEMVNYEKGDRAFYHDDPMELKKKRTGLLQLLNNISNRYKENESEIDNDDLSIKMILKNRNESNYEE